MKKVILFFAVICLAATGFAQTSGISGGITWKLLNDTLTVDKNGSGAGAMPNYCDSVPPWQKYQDVKGKFSVVIIKAVVTIGDSAFYGCDSLKKVVISSSVTAIGKGVFSRCSSLSAISVSASNLTYSSIGSVLCSEDSTQLIRCPEGRSADLTLYDRITTIDGLAFEGCRRLKTVTVSKSLTNLAVSTFLGCDSLSNIIVKANNPTYSSAGGVLVNNDTTKILIYPKGKSGKPYTIPNKVTAIGDSAFYDCDSLISVTIPQSVTTIGDSAFYHCSHLTGVTVGWETLDGVTVESDAFTDVNLDLATLHVPAGTKLLYDTASVWKDFGNRISANTMKKLSIEPDSLVFTAADSSQTITVKGVNWKLGKTGSSDAWLTLVANSGTTDSTFHIRVVANMGEPATDRRDTITVTDGDTLCRMPVRQQAPSLSVEPDTLIFTAADSSQHITLTTNTRWTVTKVNASSEWLTVSAPSGLHDSTIRIRVAKTDTLRTDTLLVEGGGRKLKIPVTQAASELSVDPDTLIFPAADSTLSIQLTTNTRWSVKKVIDPASTWLTVTPDSGIHNQTLLIRVLRTDTVRTDTLVVKGGNKTHRIPVTQTAPALTATPASLVNLLAASGSHTVTVTSNTNWTVSKVIEPTSSWLTVSPTSGKGNGTLAVTLTKNTGAERKDTLVVTDNGKITHRIPVVQAAPTLTVPTDTLKYTAAGGSLNRPVTSNTDWSASSSATWLTVSPTSGKGNGTLAVAVAANTGAARTASVTVTDGETKTSTIRVEQVASGTPSATLTLSHDRLSFTAADSTQRLVVTSDTNWTVVVVDSATWITVSPESGTGSDTLNIQVAANTTGAARETNISVLGGGLRQTVRVMQSIVATLAVDTLPKKYGGGGGVQSLIIISDTNWTVASSAAWLSVSPSSGINNHTVSLTAAANTGDAARTAVVTVTAGGVRRTIGVTQERSQPLVVIDSIPPARRGGRAKIDVSLDVPLYEPFKVQFTLTLPAGFTLDESATELASDLVSHYTLEVTPITAATWKFLIQPKPTVSTLAGSQTGYRELVHVVYTVDQSAPIGNYTLKLKQIELTGLNSGLTNQQEEAGLRVTVGQASVEEQQISCYGGILSVHTPRAERIAVYSVAGRLLYSVQKEAGAATIDLNGLPRGVLIVHGSSGWVTKVVR